MRLLTRSSWGVYGSNLYLREPWGWPPQPVGVVTLSGALAMWALLYLLVTAYVAVWQQEDAPDTHVGTYTPRTVYGQLWQICRLPRTFPLSAPSPPPPSLRLALCDPEGACVCVRVIQACGC